MAHKINSKCLNCDACRLECPRNAISIAADGSSYQIDQSLCNDCAGFDTPRCVPHCPVGAISAG
jgi:ferredoxin